MDLDLKSDMVIAVMNLIEASSHAHGSFIFDNKEKWLELKKTIDELRKKYMEEVEKEDGSQLHCFNKHILSASFRLQECGDKFLRDDLQEKAQECYKDSGTLFKMFIELNWKDEKNKDGIIENIKKGLKSVIGEKSEMQEMQKIND